MAKSRSDFLRSIVGRGYLHQATDLEGLDALAASTTLTAYVGYDCTAPSLHVGNLLSIMMLRVLQQTGHRPIILVGGGTTKIGDPSGKDSSRTLLDDAEIARNTASIRKVFGRFLNFGDGPTDAVVVDNADWLDSLEYIPFLRAYGQHFSVNRMLALDSVRLRLDREQPLSFLEFNYMILQAYDFLELSRRHDCVLQMGGSDQWGNIVGGVELARRVDGRRLHGLTVPLLTTASGEKMGKTASGAVWLNADMLSPYDYWQFWRNTEDADVGRFMRLFTEMPETEIARLESLEGEDINDAKKTLADEATAMCHGRDAAAAARETARRTFEDGAAGEDLPVIEVPRAELEAGIAAATLFHRAGLAASRGEARRLIRGGGARVNGAVWSDETGIIGDAQLGTDGQIKLSAGKKRHAVICAA
jgi:tyrosyl-tRNA synthetase